MVLNQRVPKGPPILSQSLSDFMLPSFTHVIKLETSSFCPQLLPFLTPLTINLSESGLLSNTIIYHICCLLTSLPAVTLIQILSTFSFISWKSFLSDFHNFSIHTHSLTFAHTCTLTLTHTYTLRHLYTLIHKHSNTYRNTHVDIQTHMHSRTVTCTFTLSHPLHIPASSF